MGGIVSGTVLQNLYGVRVPKVKAIPEGGPPTSPQERPVAVTRRRRSRPQFTQSQEVTQ